MFCTSESSCAGRYPAYSQLVRPALHHRCPRRDAPGLTRAPWTLRPTLEPSSQERVVFFSSAPTQAFRPPDQPRWVAQRRHLKFRSPDSAQRMATVGRPRPGVPAGACARDAAGTLWRAPRLGGPRRSLSRRNALVTSPGFSIFLDVRRRPQESILRSGSCGPVGTIQLRGASWATFPADHRPSLPGLPPRHHVVTLEEVDGGDTRTPRSCRACHRC
jgi:hypothetical protein